MIFNRDNIPELLRHIADHYDEKGFGLMWYRPDAIWLSFKGDYFEALNYIDSGVELKVKPKTRIVYSPTGEQIECPAPLSEKPKKGQEYWVEDIRSEELFAYYFWGDDKIDNLIFNARGCYATKEDAAANCRARHGL